ncbi:hypothetical protein ACWXWU_20455 [Shewanella sp. A14]
MINKTNIDKEITFLARSKKLTWVAIPLVTVLLFFAGKSKSLYEDLFSDWLNECRIIIRVTEPTPVLSLKGVNSPLSHFVDIAIFTYGTPPDALNLHIASEQQVMRNATLLPPINSQSLLEHPFSGNTCPPIDATGLCVSTSVANKHDLYQDLRVLLRPFNQHYQPIFRVLLESEKPEDANIQAFVKGQLLDSNDSACMVSRGTWLNYWVWASPISRVLLVIMFFIILAALAEAIRHYLKEENK